MVMVRIGEYCSSSSSSSRHSVLHEAQQVLGAPIDRYEPTLQHHMFDVFVVVVVLVVVAVVIAIAAIVALVAMVVVAVARVGS